MAGADWKEFGENKGEKTQVDRQTERGTDEGATAGAASDKNCGQLRIASAGNPVVTMKSLRCSRDFERQTTVHHHREGESI